MISTLSNAQLQTGRNIASADFASRRSRRRTSLARSFANSAALVDPDRGGWVKCLERPGRVSTLSVQQIAPMGKRRIAHRR
jgi:hypothetical protein